MSSPSPDILVVENHPDTLRYLVKYLNRQGYEVRTAMDMRSALASIRERSPQILISDIGLPDGDGWELLKTARAEGHRFYALSMSGFGLGGDAQRSLEAGYGRHLIKPFLLEELGKALQGRKDGATS